MLFAQTGCECRLPLYASASQIRYNPRLWPADVIKAVCQLHSRNYALVLLGHSQGKTLPELDALYSEQFRAHLIKHWNNHQPNNVARWERLDYRLKMNGRFIL